MQKCSPNSRELRNLPENKLPVKAISKKKSDQSMSAPNLLCLYEHLTANNFL